MRGSKTWTVVAGVMAAAPTALGLVGVAGVRRRRA